jgi:hypothetical protein
MDKHFLPPKLLSVFGHALWKPTKQRFVLPVTPDVRQQCADSPFAKFDNVTERTDGKSIAKPSFQDVTDFGQL